ncbi:MAG: D-alanine--D-alanine ligase family protein [Leptonema sp. (in: bacteria)]
MNNNKINLALLFGGRSTEHEISILSAKNIYQSIDKDKYTIKAFYISQEGKIFYIQNLDSFPNNKEDILKLNLKEIYIRMDSEYPFFFIEQNNVYNIKVDVFFAITHGTFGEDGSLQGLLKLLNIPFVGCDVLSSALCMDKEAMKQILIANQIPIVPFVSYKISEKDKIPYKEIVERLGLPLFVKPARQGSSVGVYKVKTLEEFKEKVSKAFEYDTKIIIEKSIEGRELECSVLGNTEIKVTIPGEIRSNHEFYSYEAKYIDPKGAELYIPAPNLTSEKIEKIKNLAFSAYKALYCEGFARVDMFYTDKEIYINEINTLPGFTDISMFPKLWEYEGLSQTHLIEEIIQLSIERFNISKNIKKTYGY